MIYIAAVFKPVASMPGHKNSWLTKVTKELPNVCLIFHVAHYGNNIMYHLLNGTVGLTGHPWIKRSHKLLLSVLGSVVRDKEKQTLNQRLTAGMPVTNQFICNPR